MLAKKLLLKQLYLKRFCAEVYCQNITFKKPKEIFTQTNGDKNIQSCSLCELSKNANGKVIGRIDAESKLTFITLKPTLENSNSEAMIANIAHRVFEEKTYNLLSLIKCKTDLTPEERHFIVCREWLKSQILKLDSKMIVIFGIEIAKYLLGYEEKLQDLRGRVLSCYLDKNMDKTNKRDFIVTYSISDLLKNISYKKAAMEDFKIAKTYLKRL